MRPRKAILLVDANERSASQMRFVLEVRGYRVVVAHDAVAALAFHDLHVDLVLGYADGLLSEWPELARRMKARLPYVPLLLVTHSRSHRVVDSLALLGNGVQHESYGMAAMLERVRVMIMRKRGPRKHAPELSAPVAVAGD